MKNISVLIFIILVLFSGCKTAYDTVQPQKGSADFSTYVALGNSLTAGYADGALYKSGQINSYPNILATQFKLVGGGDFTQPLMLDENGAGISGITPVTKLVLNPRADCKGTVSLSPAYASATINLGNLVPIGAGAKFNNLGVPGVKSYQILSPLLVANPYYGRMASNPGTSSMLSDAVAQNPTFFTLWAANNDVLGYALAGGDGASDTITSPTLVDYAIETILVTLTSNGTKDLKGAIANVPDITSIPYFTTVPYNGLALDSISAVQLSYAYSPLGIKFSKGSNGFIIEDAAAPGGKRQIKSTELILLTVPQDSLKCGGWGSLKAIPAKYVLTENEIAKIKTATTAFNTSIASKADKYNLVLVDMYTNLNQLKAGITYNGISYNATFVTGGAFSLDGVHLNPRGYALVANYYIEAINLKYGSTVPTVDANSYTGITFP